MTDYNEVGHVEPVGKLIAVPLADYLKMPEGTNGLIYRRRPDDMASRVDPWRTILSVTPSTLSGTTAIRFRENGEGVFLDAKRTAAQVVYVEQANAPKAAHDPAQSQVSRAVAQLRGAVERARAAADEAERSIKDHAGDPAYAAARVMHALAWGHANAISCVESALAASEDAHTIRRLSAGEKPL